VSISNCVFTESEALGVQAETLSDSD
jgi:hypothetical protein